MAIEDTLDPVPSDFQALLDAHNVTRGDDLILVLKEQPTIQEVTQRAVATAWNLIKGSYQGTTAVGDDLWITLRLDGATLSFRASSVIQLGIANKVGGITA